MAYAASALYASPNPLAAHYRRFRVGERLLLTGHSHQAWPDRAEIGMRLAWDDAAEHVDAKWERAFERAARVRAGFARLLDTSPDTLSLGTSTHELLVKWLSALPLRERPCVVTTDSEFHSARRQLARLEEEGLHVVRVPARPASASSSESADAISASASVARTNRAHAKTLGRIEPAASSGASASASRTVSERTGSASGVP